MPKQIKTPKMKPYEKKYRKSVIGLFITTILFLGTLFGLISTIISTEGKILTTILFSTYILFIISCTVSIVLAVKSYKYEDNFTVLFQGILEFVTVITCVMNLRFALVMLFSAYNLDSVAEKFMGSLSSNEFVVSQYTSWICILVGSVVTLIMGILGIIKLAKDKK